MGTELITMPAESSAAHIAELAVEEYELDALEGCTRLLAHDRPELLARAQAQRVWYFEDGSAHLAHCTSTVSAPEHDLILARTSLLHLLASAEDGCCGGCLTDPEDAAILAWEQGCSAFRDAEQMILLERNAQALLEPGTPGRTQLLADVLAVSAALLRSTHPVVAAARHSAEEKVRSLFGELTPAELGTLIHSLQQGSDRTVLSDHRRRLDEVFQEILLGIRADELAEADEDESAPVASDEEHLVLIDHAAGAYPAVAQALACSSVGWVGDPDSPLMRGMLRCPEQLLHELRRAWAMSEGSWTPVRWDPAVVALQLEHESSWRELAAIALLLTRGQQPDSTELAEAITAARAASQQ